MTDGERNLMPARTLRTLLRVVRERGHSADEALRLCALDEAILAADNDTPVSALAYSRLYRYVIELLQDESFGLGGAHQMPPGTFRMMCLFIIHCRTLGEAIHRAAEFFRYCSRFLDQPVAVPESLPGQDADHTIIVLGLHQGRTGDLRADASTVYMMQNFYSWLIDSPLPVTRVLLAHPAPASAQRYEALFRAPVCFEAPCHGLELAADSLAIPLAQNEETLRDFLRSAPYPLIRPYGRQRRQSLAQAVRERLSRGLHDPALSLAQIAQQLGMTSRTVHRKLEREGTSFRALKETVLREAALHYLGNPDLSIDAVATLMGFRESSAFYRSFKRWTGQSPGAYRQLLGQGHAPADREPA